MFGSPPDDCSFEAVNARLIKAGMPPCKRDGSHPWDTTISPRGGESWWYSGGFASAKPPTTSFMHPLRPGETESAESRRQRENMEKGQQEMAEMSRARMKQMFDKADAARATQEARNATGTAFTEVVKEG